MGHRRQILQEILSAGLITNGSVGFINNAVTVSYWASQNKGENCYECAVILLTGSVFEMLDDDSMRQKLFLRARKNRRGAKLVPVVISKLLNRH